MKYIYLIFLIVINLAYAGTFNYPDLPEPKTLVVKLFFVLIGALVSYGFYFAVKNYIKYLLIALAIYTVSLIILDYFHIIKLNVNNIKDYLTELFAILIYLYKLIQSKISFTLGVIIGILLALFKDNKIPTIQFPKKNKG